MSGYSRFEKKCLSRLPACITALRFRIILGYLIVAVIALTGWAHIESAWQYLAALLAPIGALLGALLALKLSVVAVTLLTLITSFLKMFSGFLMVVIKPGILKAIFVPPLMSLIRWIHRKSARLQLVAEHFYQRLKHATTIIVTWWNQQNTIDKALLSGFLIPLLTIVLVVFLIQRATGLFAIKKLIEQIVQATTKFIIRHFHRIPVVGRLPAWLTARATTLTLAQDRDDLAKDLKNLGREIYNRRHSTRQNHGNKPP